MDKIAWGITGSGDFMRESLDLMKDIAAKNDVRIDVFLSREAEIVLKYYHYMSEIKSNFSNLFTEQGPNIPFLSGKLQIGKYRVFIICPATANTVAKIAHGIADSLITNSAAQAMKVDVPVYIFPVDQKEGEVMTILPDGRQLKLHIRDVDLKNVNLLKDMQGITVVEKTREIWDVIQASTFPSAPE
ncbi:MAG: archaeoflavoprotein AfpA [Theionarchaea archaeon]|nr:archaeoflavoprotein AfpA [Theionarchaea archaeon]